MAGGTATGAGIDRWNPWRPHGRPELEEQTLFMPQHLLEELDPHVAGCQPVRIASVLLGYVRYHQWRRTPEELLIFLRTDLLVRYLDDERSEKCVHWNRDRIIKEAEERPYLGRVCFEVLYQALVSNPMESPLPEEVEVDLQRVVEAARRYLSRHAEMLESAEAGAGLIVQLSHELEMLGFLRLAF